MKRTIPVAILALALMACSGAAQAQTLTQFFRNSDFTPLVQSKHVRILVAQSATGQGVSDVNLFDNFFTMNADGTLVVNFDKNLKNLGQKSIPGWDGQIPYDNHTIKDDIQSSYSVVKNKYSITGLIAGVAVYVAESSHYMIYVYSIPVTPGKYELCQQYLFITNTGGAQPGMKAPCLWSLKNLPAMGKRLKR